MTGLLFVCLGAMAGAPARYLMDRAVQARHDTLVPWGTILVNLTGSCVLGLLSGVATGHSVPSGVFLFAGTGFCGAFTTYSAFTYETHRLVETKRWLHALVNVTVSVIGGLGAALIGYTVGALI
jgi:fluoride exporter